MIITSATVKQATLVSKWIQDNLLNRTDAYGSYDLKGQHWRKAELTDKVLLTHLLHKSIIGVPAINPLDSTTRWGCIDIDNHSEEIKDANWHTVHRICEILDQHDVSYICEDSNGKGGFHLWIVWDKPIPAYDCRRFLYWLLVKTKADPHIHEVFPKQNTIPKDGFGNFVRLFGKHYKHNHISRYWDGKKWHADIGFICSVKPNSTEVLKLIDDGFTIPSKPQPKRLSAVLDVLEGDDWFKEIDGDLKTFRLDQLFADHNMLVDEGEGWLNVVCPWSEEHTTGELAGIHMMNDKFPWPAFSCLHQHCEGRRLRDVVEKFGKEECQKYMKEYQHDPMAGWAADLAAEPQEVFVEAKLIKPPLSATVVVPAKPVVIEGDYKSDPRTAYLWQGKHAYPENITEEDRLQRANAVLAAYDLIPPTGLLPTFLRLNLPTTDLAAKLMLGAAFSSAASIIGRNVHFKMSERKIYPHLWVAAIAGSGQRKSTGVNKVKALLSGDNELRKRVAPSENTMAAFFQRFGIEVKQNDWGEWDYETAINDFQTNPLLCDKGVGTICIDEIGGWLKTLGNSYNNGLKEFLTGAFEAPPDIRKETKTQGAYYIPAPCFNMIGASTPIWLSDNIREADVQGGFLGRFTFFVSPNKEYNLTMTDDINEMDLTQLEIQKDILKQLSGEITFSEEGERCYMEEVRKIKLPPRLESWQSRLANNVIKFSMLYTLTERGLDDISAQDVSRAVRLVNILWQDLEGFVYKHLSETKEDARLTKLYELIKEFGPNLSHQKALKKSKLYAKDFRMLIETLAERGQVAVLEEDATSPNGKKPRYYTAK